MKEGMRRAAVSGDQRQPAAPPVTAAPSEKAKEGNSGKAGQAGGRGFKQGEAAVVVGADAGEQVEPA